jgi:hypothetical protein
MTASVTLRASLPRDRFWLGEPIPLMILVENPEDAPPLAVPVPFAPSQRDLTFLLHDASSTALLAPELATAAAGPTVRVPPADFYLTEVSLTAWHDFAPGSYRIEVHWAHPGGEARAAPAAFEIVAPQALALAIAPDTCADAVSLPPVIATVSGPGLGVFLERRFLVDIEEDTLFPHAGDIVRFVADHALGSPIPVTEAADPKAWIAWSSGRGILARPGYEVTGAAEASWPEEMAVEAIVPAVETAHGELLVYSLRAMGDRRQLVETRFTAPVVTTEEAEGPDDWDDEILVPGPVRETVIGDMQGGSGTTTLARAAEGDIRIVALSTAGSSGVLYHVSVRGGAVTDVARLELPGVALPHAKPAVFVDRAGDTVVAILLSRAGDKSLAEATVGVVLARFDGSGPVVTGESWLGSPSAAPVSAAVAFSYVETERPFFRCVVLCGDGSLFGGDGTGYWESHLPVAQLLVPLVFVTCESHAQVGVRGAHGPTLERLYPS